MKILTFFHLLFFLLLVSGCNNSDMPVDPIPQLIEISEKDTDMELNAFFLPLTVLMIIIFLILRAPILGNGEADFYPQLLTLLSVLWLQRPLLP